MHERSSPRLDARILARLWTFVALSLAVLEFARVGQWLGYAGRGRLSHWSTLGSALLEGARYDLAAGTSWALLIGLLVLPLCLFRRRRTTWVPRTLTTLYLVLLAAFALASVCEFYYYGFYHSRFDPIMFGLFEDDTSAVLASVWHDYPIVGWLLGLGTGLVVAVFVYRHCTRWLELHLDLRRPWARWVAAALQILVLGILARGSLGTFPLIRQDVVFAPDPFENQLVLNAPLTIYKAVRARQERIDIGDDPLTGLHALGFDDPAQAASVLGLPHDNDARIAHALFATAPGQPAGRKPNVVLALLESFGYDMLHADGPQNDMLGRLRRHVSHDYLFTNFITGQNGTHPELENLLLGSPITPLTIGAAGRIAFATSAVLPFKRAGYRTVFIYGGGRDWRNIGKVFRRQGFDEIYDERNIRARFPAAGTTPWGVYDAYLFRFAREILDDAQARGQPVFLFLLTTTNHPPYLLDTPHRKPPLNPAALDARGNPDLALRRKIMATYQYQADQFGAFLDGIEDGPLADDTIVAGVGDHNLRDHYVYSLPAEQPDVDRVLALFRLPPALRPAHVDTTRFSGHEDIVPTLVNLALPGARYFNTGVDLFAPPRKDDHGLALFQRTYLPGGVAFGLVHPRWHAWTRPFTRIAVDATPIPPEAAREVHRVAAGVALRDWYIRTRVLAARQHH